jgi:hypothetical protein
MVRAEPAETPIPERATAYRVELADLPLPTPERLRRPGEGTGWRGDRAIPEEPTLASAWKGVHPAAVEPALARPNTKPNPSSGPVPQPVYDKILPKLTPIVVGGTEPEKSPHEKFEKTDWPASPTPPGPATHEPFILSLGHKPFELSFQPKDLPRLPLEDDAAPKTTIPEEEISSPAGVIPGFAARPTTQRTIPEPGSALLFGAALAALASARRSAAMSRQTGACLGGGSKPSGDSKR